MYYGYSAGYRYSKRTVWYRNCTRTVRYRHCTGTEVATVVVSFSEVKAADDTVSTRGPGYVGFIHHTPPFSGELTTGELEQLDRVRFIMPLCGTVAHRTADCRFQRQFF